MKKTNSISCKSMVVPVILSLKRAVNINIFCGNKQSLLWEKWRLRVIHQCTSLLHPFVSTLLPIKNSCQNNVFAYAFSQSSALCKNKTHQGPAVPFFSIEPLHARTAASSKASADSTASEFQRHFFILSNPSLLLLLLGSQPPGSGTRSMEHLTPSLNLCTGPSDLSPGAEVRARARLPLSAGFIRVPLNGKRQCSPAGPAHAGVFSRSCGSVWKGM